MIKPSPMLEDLKKLLVEGSATTQESIKKGLIKLGFEVNQAKISRILRKLGAVKISNESGQIVYRLPQEPLPPLAKNSLSSLIVKIESNESLIVVHTSPGSASLFGRVIDHHRTKLNILGTVAGDDTVIVIPKTVHMIPQILLDIKHFLCPLK